MPLSSVDPKRFILAERRGKIEALGAVPLAALGVFSTRVLLTTWHPPLHSGLLLAIASRAVGRLLEAGSVNSSALTSKKLAGDVLG